MSSGANWLKIILFILFFWGVGLKIHFRNSLCSPSYPPSKLQGFPSFDQNPNAGSHSSPDHDSSGGGKAQCTGAGDSQDGYSDLEGELYSDLCGFVRILTCVRKEMLS